MSTFNKPQHLLFLRNPEGPSAWGGLEKLMFEWFERIDYNQHKVTLSISKNWVSIFKEKLREKNIPVTVVELPFEPKIDASIKRFLNLISFLWQKKPSTIVYIQGWTFSFNLSDVLAGFLICPGKVFMHENSTPPDPCPKESKRYFGIIQGVGLWWYIQIYSANLRARISQKIVVVSNEIKEKLVSLWHYPVEKISVNYHGIDLSSYNLCAEIRQKMRDSLNIPSQETVILVASRLSKEKCIYRTIEAFDTISRDNENLRLLILGSGPLEGDLRNLAKSLPSANKIIFLGHVNNVPDYLKMSDIYVLSSDIEGLSLSLVEAMTAGLICVSTNCPGTNELIIDGVNGFLVEKNTKGVINGLNKALGSSSGERHEIREKAIRFAKDTFEINSRVRNVFDVMGIK